MKLTKTQEIELAVWTALFARDATQLMGIGTVQGARIVISTLNDRVHQLEEKLKDWERPTGGK